MDSACSSHYTANKEWFSYYSKVDGGCVSLGNDQTCSVKGVGSIRIQMFDGKDRSIELIAYLR